MKRIEAKPARERDNEQGTRNKEDRSLTIVR